MAYRVDNFTKRYNDNIKNIFEDIKKIKKILDEQQGPIGAKGETGLQGPQGEIGLQGPQGEIGSDINAQLISLQAQINRINELFDEHNNDNMTS